MQYTSWRLIFLINVPVAIAGYWMNRRDMPDYRLARAHRFDLPGFLLFATASALLLTASELAGSTPLPWRAIGACAVVAIMLGSIYVWHAGRTAFPVADLKLLRMPSVQVALAGGIFTRLGISGMFVLLMLFLQLGCGWSPLAAGLIMVPQAVGSIVAKWADQSRTGPLRLPPPAARQHADRRGAAGHVRTARPDHAELGWSAPWHSFTAASPACNTPR